MNWILETALFSLLASSLRMATPLLFAAMGGMLSERSGVVNIALEGFMLMGAFFGAIAAYYTHSPWLGLVMASVGGALFAALYAWCVIEWRADQIIGGTAINLLAIGLPPFLSKILFDSTAATPSLPLADRFSWEPILLAWVLVVFIELWRRKSRSGVWVWFAGEHPEALAAAGIQPRKVRWFAVLASGWLAGIGGASLSIFLASSFARNMTAGRGFMALAALILGKWKPIPVACACVLFGFFDALQIRLQGSSFAGLQVPVQLIQVLPYLVTLLVLGGIVGQSRAPKALGTPLQR